MPVQIAQRRDNGTQSRQPMARRRAEEAHEIAVRQELEDELGTQVSLDELERFYEVRARDPTQQRVFAPQ